MVFSMRKDDSIFNEQNDKKSGLKYFIIAFSVFVVILAVVSAFLLMKSIDFDLNNIVGGAAETSTSADNETATEIKSVSNLTGKSDIIFICTDSDNNLDFLFVVSTSFDNKTMQVRTMDKSSTAIYDGQTLTCAEIYEKYRVDGVKAAVANNFGIVISKYVKSTPTQFKNIISYFPDIAVNVKGKIDYSSDSFTLELEPGRQVLSSDYIYKYLLISDNYTRSAIVCDIINSLLTPENAENSDKLFKKFVNSCDTDITAYDYADKIDKITIYSSATDKFLPIPM